MKLRLISALVIFFGSATLPLWIAEPANAVKTGQITVVCANSEGTQKEFRVGWDNTTGFFEGKGNIAALFCSIASGGYPTFISTTAPEETWFYNGIAPTPILIPTPEASQSASATPESSTVPSPEPSPSPAPSESSTATQPLPPEPSPSNTPSVESTPSPSPSQSPEPSPEQSSVPDPLPSPSVSPSSNDSSTIVPDPAAPLPDPIPAVPDPIPVAPEPVVRPDPAPAAPEAAPEAEPAAPEAEPAAPEAAPNPAPAPEAAPDPAPAPEPQPEPQPDPAPEVPEIAPEPPLTPSDPAPEAAPEAAEKPKVPKGSLLVPHIQQDQAGVLNGGIELFGTAAQPQVIGENGKLTPAPPLPGSGGYLDPEAITTAETFIGQPGGMAFNSPDIAVPVAPIEINLDIPGVGQAAQALANTYVALANVGNDMSPITRKKAKKIVVATIVAGAVMNRRQK